MSTLEVNTINPQSGTTITIGGSGDTVTLGSGATQSGFGGTNTPTLFAYLNTVQTATNNAYTLVQLNTASIDTASGMNTGTYTYTVQEAGRYLIKGCVSFTTGAVAALRDHNISIRKNGTSIAHVTMNPNSSWISSNNLQTSVILDLSVSDAITLYGHMNVSGGSVQFEGNGTEISETCLYMVKLIG